MVINELFAELLDNHIFVGDDPKSFMVVPPGETEEERYEYLYWELGEG